MGHVFTNYRMDSFCHKKAPPGVHLGECTLKTLGIFFWSVDYVQTIRKVDAPHSYFLMNSGNKHDKTDVIKFFIFTFSKLCLKNRRSFCGVWLISFSLFILHGSLHCKEKIAKFYWWQPMISPGRSWHSEQCVRRTRGQRLGSNLLSGSPSSRLVLSRRHHPHLGPSELVSLCVRLQQGER